MMLHWPVSLYVRLFRLVFARRFAGRKGRIQFGGPALGGLGRPAHFSCFGGRFSLFRPVGGAYPFQVGLKFAEFLLKQSHLLAAEVG